MKKNVDAPVKHLLKSKNRSSRHPLLKLRASKKEAALCYSIYCR